MLPFPTALLPETGDEPLTGSGGAGLTIPAAGYWPLLLLLVADRVFDRIGS